MVAFKYIYIKSMYYRDKRKFTTTVALRITEQHGVRSFSSRKNVSSKIVRLSDTIVDRDVL